MRDRGGGIVLQKLALILLLIALVTLPVSGFADSLDYDSIKDLQEQLNALLGYESNPGFELGGYAIDVKGSYSIDTQTEDEIVLSTGGETIMFTRVSADSLGAEEYIEKYGVETVTNAIIQMLSQKYSASDCVTATTAAGISTLSFVQRSTGYGLGMTFLVHGSDIMCVSLIVTDGFAEYMEYDLDEYIPEEMDSILAGISLLAE